LVNKVSHVLYIKYVHVKIFKPLTEKFYQSKLGFTQFIKVVSYFIGFK
jgi:hypothetical protein